MSERPPFPIDDPPPPAPEVGVPIDRPSDDDPPSPAWPDDIEVPTPTPPQSDRPEPMQFSAIWFEWVGTRGVQPVLMLGRRLLH